MKALQPLSPMFCAPNRILESRNGLGHRFEGGEGGANHHVHFLDGSELAAEVRHQREDSATVLLHFQLPAIISFRSLSMQIHA